MRRWPTRAPPSADELVTFGEAVALVGEEFRNVLHVVAKDIGVAGRVAPRIRPGPASRGSARSRRTTGRRCSTALRARVDRRRNAEAVATHPDAVTTDRIARDPAPPHRRSAQPRCRQRPAARPAGPRRPLIPPYTLGVWLGDGHTDAARFTTRRPGDRRLRRGATASTYGRSGPAVYSIAPAASDELAERTCVVCGAAFRPRATSVLTCGRSCGRRPASTAVPPHPAGLRDLRRRHRGDRQRVAALRRLPPVDGFVHRPAARAGVLGDKHIPAAYLRASEAQRRALLAGLLDTDGTVAPDRQRAVRSTVAAARRRRPRADRQPRLPVHGDDPGRSRAVRAESSVAYTLRFTRGRRRVPAASASGSRTRSVARTTTTARTGSPV